MLQNSDKEAHKTISKQPNEAPHSPAKVAPFLVAPRDIFCLNLPETAASGKMTELWGEASWVDEGP